jgi:serine/threonine protein kinase
MATSLPRFGKWQAIRELGKGGQGTVYLATDTTQLDLDDLFEKLRWSIGNLAASGTAETNRQNAAALLRLIERYLNREDGQAVVALKVLDSAARGDAKTRERFKVELDVLRQVDHPGVLRVIDADVDGGWMTMPYYPEGALSSDPSRYQGA